MNITRRSALLAGAAALATGATTAPVAALAVETDARLFRAIARWRKARDAYEAERDRQGAILDRAEAEMPAYCAASEAHTAALHVAPYHDRTAEEWRAVEETEAVLKPFREPYDRRVRDLGYDEDVTDRLLCISNDACAEAMAVPARTLAGLRAKLEMLLTQYPEASSCLEPERDDYGPNLTSDLWRPLVADIRCLTGEVQS
jgi:hypothetical protein